MRYSPSGGNTSGEPCGGTVALGCRNAGVWECLYVPDCEECSSPGEALFEKGIPMLASHKEFTRTHQIIADVRQFGGGLWGNQFIAKEFKLFLQEAGLQHVRTAVRHPQSNGKIERFHRTIKQECLFRQSLLDLKDARQQIARYIHGYNTKRLHNVLYYLTPENFLLDRIEQRLAERNRRLEDARVNRISTSARIANSTLIELPD